MKRMSLFVILLFLIGCGAEPPAEIQEPEEPVVQDEPPVEEETVEEVQEEEAPMEETIQGPKRVKLATTMGDIVIELAEDMPITAGNFEKLVSEGFYDGVVFHRIIKGFMIQGGDPTGTGRGGPGYDIQDEFTDNNKNNKGTLSMANSGPNTGGSQFFINLVNNNFLDDKHPVFGKVVEGQDVVDAMGKVPTGQQDRPVEEVKIITATLI